MDVTPQLGIWHIFSSHYRPQANGRVESFHKFLRNCIRIFTIKEDIEWNKIVNIICGVYSCFLNGESHDSLLCLEEMFMFIQ